MAEYTAYFSYEYSKQTGPEITDSTQPKKLAF